MWNRGVAHPSEPGRVLPGDATPRKPAQTNREAQHAPACEGAHRNAARARRSRIQRLPREGKKDAPEAVPDARVRATTGA